MQLINAMTRPKSDPNFKLRNQKETFLFIHDVLFIYLFY